MLLLTSVGEGGGNNEIEVKIVQMLLNAWLGDNGQELLKVDGIAGPLTKGAIVSYQRKKGGVADGRVDPAGQTIKSLVIFNAEVMKSAALNTTAGRHYFSKPYDATSRASAELDSSTSLDTIYVASLRSLLKRPPNSSA